MNLLFVCLFVLEIQTSETFLSFIKVDLLFSHQAFSKYSFFPLIFSVLLNGHRTQ